MTELMLTEAQADGRACIICGNEDGPFEVAVEPGYSPSGVQLFRCVSMYACREDARAKRAKS